jgi:hypothetical protein
MSPLYPVYRWLWSACLVLLGGVSSAHAHLVVSQRGTLNIVETGTYMVLSLPVSAFTGIDDNHDGLLSLEELRQHAPDIEAQLRNGVALADSQQSYPLDGLMLNTVPPEGTPTAAAAQLAVLGRFATHPDATDLRFSLRLFGKGPDEQTEQISVTRGSQTQLMTLSPHSPQQEVLPSPLRILVHQVYLGVEHVLSGWDHVLFLLVVLCAGTGWRHVFLALTCFTVGHAISLSACVWFGLNAPSQWVEPAIAATIVGTAWFDRWAASRQKKLVTAARYLLVFGCALIHGLGLAGALTALGIDPVHRALTLVGFNAGIEIGQLSAACAVILVSKPLAKMGGAAWKKFSRNAVSYTAIGIGSYWLVERLAA